MKKENKDLIDFKVNIFDMQLITKKKSSEEIKKMTIKQFWKLDSELNESDYELNDKSKYFIVKKFKQRCESWRSVQN